MEKLKRELKLFDVTFIGVGVTIGAGIYALLGVATQSSGNSIWLSFLIGAILAILTGLSYSEFDYVEHAFNKNLAFLIGIMIIILGSFSVATVSLGFSGYLNALFNTNIILGAIALILVSAVINYYSMKEVSILNEFATIIQVIGLFIIIVLGLRFIGNVNYFEMPFGFKGVLQASALIFFAYIGFESIVKFEEETINPGKVIPKAIILSVIIASIIYILVSISAVSVIPWQELGKSSAPLSLIALKEFGNNGFFVLSLIALIATASTVLVYLSTISRMLYGMAEEKSLPKIFYLIDNKRKTPYVAIFSLTFLTIIFAFIGDIKIVASLTNILLFITYSLVNLSLIVLRYKKPYIERKFMVKWNIGKFNIPAFLGFITSIILLYYILTGLI